MERQAKIWGERWLLRQDSTHATSYLKLKKGYRCSWHSHSEKYNLFFLCSGLVGIVVEELGERQEIMLKPGECCTVKPGQWHEFRVYEDSDMLEEMYVSYSEDDIIRQKEGGPL